MDLAMKVYENMVRELVKKNGIDPLHKDWEALSIIVTRLSPSVLKEYAEIPGTFFAAENVSFRPPKTMDRIHKKLTTDRPKINPDFKVCSDLSALWITAPLQDLKKEWKELIDKFEKEDFVVYVDQPLVDVIGRLYVYKEGVTPTIVEVWVTHPMAKLVFGLNSYSREHPDAPSGWSAWKVTEQELKKLLEYEQ